MRSCLSSTRSLSPAPAGTISGASRCSGRCRLGHEVALATIGFAASASDPAAYWSCRGFHCPASQAARRQSSRRAGTCRNVSVLTGGSPRTFTVSVAQAAADQFRANAVVGLGLDVLGALLAGAGECA